MSEKAGRAILDTMVEAGFSEAVTVTFIAEADAKPFAMGELIRTQHAGWKARRAAAELISEFAGGAADESECGDRGRTAF